MLTEKQNCLLRKCLWVGLILFLINFQNSFSAEEKNFQKGIKETQRKEKKGAVWFNVFPINTKIFQLLVDPTNSNRMFALTYRGLYKSVNGGLLWEEIVPFHKDIDSGYIRFNPSNAQILYMGINIKGKNSSLVKSLDSGNWWNDISGGVIKSSIRNIEIDPVESNVIYIISGGSIYKTLNGGKSWGDITQPEMKGKITSISIDPNNHLHIVACGEDIYKKRYPFFSRDGGINWEEIKFDVKIDEFPGERFASPPAPPDWWKFFCIMRPLTTTFFLAGAGRNGWYPSHYLISADDGATWQDISIKREKMRLRITWHDFLPGNEIFYVGTDKGLYKTENRGKNWNEIPFIGPAKDEWIYIQDAYIKDINQIYSVPYADRTDLSYSFIYGMEDPNGYGIYVTYNEGKSWLPRYFGLPSRTTGKRLLFTDTSSIFIGDLRGYWVSNNNGFSWKWCQTSNDGDSHVTQIFRSKDVSYILNNTTFIRTSTLLKLKDGEEIKTLKLPPDRYISCIGGSRVNPEIVYVSSIDGHLFLSDDGGFSWQEIKYSFFLRSPIPGNYKITDSFFVIHPRYENIMYFIIKPTEWPSEFPSSRILRSFDSGKTWEDITEYFYGAVNSFRSTLIKNKKIRQNERKFLAEFFDISSLSVDPTKKSPIYITTKTDGVYYSQDGGKSWVPKNNFFPFQTDIQFNDFAIDWNNSNILYLATNHGLYISNDGGGAWEFSNDIRDKLYAIAISNSLVLIRGDHGIYRFSTTEELIQDYQKYQKEEKSYINWIKKSYQKPTDVSKLKTESLKEEEKYKDIRTEQKPASSLNEGLDKISTISAKTEEEFKRFMKSEEMRLVKTLGLVKFIELDILIRKANKASKERKWQEVIDTYQKALQLDPQYYSASYITANVYNGLNQPDKALEYALKGLQKFPYNLLYAITAESYAKKGDKNRTLLWLEGAFKGGFRAKKEEIDESVFQFATDPEYLALLQKYEITAPSQDALSSKPEEGQKVTAFPQKIYEIEIDSKRYFVIKTSNEKIYGSKGSRSFLDSNGSRVTNPSLIKKLVKTAWVYEYIVQENPLTTTYAGWEKPKEKIYLIKGIMETYKDIKKYEKAQDLMVRTFIDLSAMVIAGHTSTASLTKTLANFTIGNFQELLLSEVSLKNLLGFVSIESLEETLKKYELCQENIEEVQGRPLDYMEAETIYNLYIEGYIREPHYKLLVSLMPKKSIDLVLKAIKSAGSEVTSLLISPAIKTTEDAKQLLTLSTMYKGIEILYNTLGNTPEFREFGDARKLVQMRIQNAEKTMQALEENCLKK